MKKMLEQLIKHWYIVAFFSIIAILPIIALSVCCIDSNIITSTESTILVFVGILATFVVVGNYAQVTDIKNDVNSKMKELNDKIENAIINDPLKERLSNIEYQLNIKKMELNLTELHTLAITQAINEKLSLVILYNYEYMVCNVTQPLSKAYFFEIEQIGVVNEQSIIVPINKTDKKEIHLPDVHFIAVMGKNFDINNGTYFAKPKL